MHCAWPHIVYFHQEEIYRIQLVIWKWYSHVYHTSSSERTPVTNSTASPINPFQRMRRSLNSSGITLRFLLVYSSPPPRLATCSVPWSSQAGHVKITCLFCIYSWTCPAPSDHVMQILYLRSSVCVVRGLFTLYDHRVVRNDSDCSTF